MTHRARNHFLIALAAFIFACVAYYFWFSYVSALSDQVAVLTNEIDLKTQDSTRSAQAKTALAALAESEASINARFISPADIVTYLESAEGTGKELGSVVKVNAVSEDSAVPVGHLLLALSVTGSFESVQRTLGVLSNAPIDSTLGSLTVDSAPPQGSSTPQWTAATTLSVGVRAGASGIGGLPQAVQSMVASSSVLSAAAASSSSTTVNAGIKPIAPSRKFPVTSAL